MKKGWRNEVIRFFGGALEVLGIVTGNPGIQLGAYASRVVDMIVLNLQVRYLDLDNEMKQDFERVIMIACENMKRELKKESNNLSRFFETTPIKIDLNHNNVSFNEIAFTVYEELIAHSKREMYDVSPGQLKKLVDLFFGILLNELLRYPKLAQYLQFYNLSQCEKRLTSLESLHQEKKGSMEGVLNFSVLKGVCRKKKENIQKTYITFLMPDMRYAGRDESVLKNIIDKEHEHFWISAIGGAGKTTILRKYASEINEGDINSCCFYISLGNISWLDEEAIVNIERKLLYYWIGIAYLCPEGIYCGHDYLEIFDCMFRKNTNYRYIFFLDGYNEISLTKKKLLKRAMKDIEINFADKLKIKFVVSARKPTKDKEWTNIELQPLKAANLACYFWGDGKRADDAQAIIDKYGFWLATPLMAKIYYEIFGQSLGIAEGWKVTIADYERYQWFFEGIADEPKTKSELIEVWWFLQFYHHSAENEKIKQELEIFHFILYRFFPAICFFAYEKYKKVWGTKYDYINYLKRAYCYFYKYWNKLEFSHGEQYEEITQVDLLQFNNHANKLDWNQLEKKLLNNEEIICTELNEYFKNVICAFFEDRINVLVECEYDHSLMIQHQDLGDVLVAMHIKNALILEQSKFETWLVSEIWSNQMEHIVAELCAKNANSCLAENILQIFADKMDEERSVVLGKLFDLEQRLFGGIFCKQFYRIDMSYIEFGKYRFSTIDGGKASTFINCKIEKVQPVGLLGRMFIFGRYSYLDECDDEWYITDRKKVYKYTGQRFLEVYVGNGLIDLYDYGIFIVESALYRIVDGKSICLVEKINLSERVISDDNVLDIEKYIMVYKEGCIYIDAGKIFLYIKDGLERMESIGRKEIIYYNEENFDTQETIIKSICIENEQTMVKKIGIIKEKKLGWQMKNTMVIEKGRLYYAANKNIISLDLQNFEKEEECFKNDKDIRSMVAVDHYFVIGGDGYVKIIRKSNFEIKKELVAVKDEVEYALNLINNRYICIKTNSFGTNAWIYDIKSDYMFNMGNYMEHMMKLGKNYSIYFEGGWCIYSNVLNKKIYCAPAGRELKILEEEDGYIIVALEASDFGPAFDTYSHILFVNKTGLIEKICIIEDVFRYVPSDSHYIYNGYDGVLIVKFRKVRKRIVDWLIREECLYLMFTEKVLYDNTIPHTYIKIVTYDLNSGECIYNDDWYCHYLGIEGEHCYLAGFSKKEEGVIYLLGESGELYKSKCISRSKYVSIKLANIPITYQYEGDSIRVSRIIGYSQEEISYQKFILEELLEIGVILVWLKGKTYCIFLRYNKIKDLSGEDSKGIVVMRENKMVITCDNEKLFVHRFTEKGVTITKVSVFSEEILQLSCEGRNIYVLTKEQSGKYVAKCFVINSENRLYSQNRIRIHSRIMPYLVGSKVVVVDMGYLATYDMLEGREEKKPLLTSKIRNCRFVNCEDLTERSKQYIVQSGGVIE